MHTRTAAAVLLAAGLALTACSSSDSGSKNPDEPGVATTRGTLHAAAERLDAAGIMTKLTAAIPTAHKTIEYTAATDKNGKLGRPHQYTSKINFADTRVDQAKANDSSDGDKTDIAYGGAVEVFATAADAKAWVKYLDGIGQAVGGLVTPDYLLRQDRYVLRVSHLLTPDQVGEYKTVLAKLN
jgi:hypothetical protein